MVINSNAFRSIATAVGLALPVIAQFFGCHADAADPTAACAGSWLTPTTATAVGLGLVALSWLTKAFAGTGTATQNLFAPAVPVVPEHVAGPGTVTQAQVNEP